MGWVIFVSLSKWVLCAIDLVLICGVIICVLNFCGLCCYGFADDSYKEEDHCKEEWQEDENEQYKVQVYEPFWEIHLVLLEGTYHPRKICGFGWFEGHFHSQLISRQRLE